MTRKAFGQMNQLLLKSLLFAHSYIHTANRPRGAGAQAWAVLGQQNLAVTKDYLVAALLIE